MTTADGHIKNSHSLERSRITTHIVYLPQVQSPVSSLYASDALVKAPPSFTKVMTWPHTHTHTHTHTNMRLVCYFCGGFSIDLMIFILYKLYILSHYTNPIPPNLPITENVMLFYVFKKKKHQYDL